ncbi:helix-turn-helix domain-containing protein [Konateibacter massiliensis]|uniref:helix-turn-helix domain-containing protein n=1 Tax=Konateibacter massiliensis TaxID=2002841 RepID=UPI000C144F4E|nr:AraC family transcriptional regulator [Konateibacter massiliensis]
MGYTEEYKLGLGAMTDHLHFDTKYHNHYAFHTFPGTWENGWINEVHSCDGLFVGSAWFTTQNVLNYTMHIELPCLFVLCIDTGEITLTQKGKAPRTLTPFTHLFINPGSPVRITVPAGMHVCFTSVLIFDSCIETFLNATGSSYPIRVKDAVNWKTQHVDTPNVMLVMEQLRWGVRGNRLPPPAYLCKAIELLCLFAHNLDREKQKNSRRNYVTWNDEKKLYRVKERIDQNPLSLPTTEELCHLAQMSESKLRISFKSLYNITLYAYMREAIMKRAMQMLADDELNIKNIAHLCGYENSAKFSAAFKAIHGITPSGFRKTFGL